MSSIARRISVLLVFACVALGSNCQTPKVMDNSAVLKMKDAGLGDDIIAQTISASAGQYDTSTDAIIALKQKGLGDKVIGAMLSKNAGGGAAAPAASQGGSQLPAGVDEIGVYYKNKAGAWTEFQPEIVNYKSGGFLKSVATDGLVKGDKNGHVPGKTATLQLAHPVEILIYAPEGTAPNEYQLLLLRQNSNNREFRSETGGFVHSSSGAERDRKDFASTKIGPRLYTVTLGPETVPGEYGILPPGSISSTNAASAGKIDTFRLVE